MEHESTITPRAQLQYPLDLESIESVKRALEGPDPVVDVNFGIGGTNFLVTDPVVYLVDATGGAITMDLPKLEGVRKGERYDIKKTDSSTNAVTIDGFDTEVIDDGTTAVITAQYENVTIISSGTAWHIV